MDLRKHILRKLFRRRVVGGKHTAVEHALAGIPSHEIGNAKKALDELVKDAFIVTKPTSYGVQISLNPEKMEEIKIIIEMEN